MVETNKNLTDAERAYAQAQAYGRDLARLYAAEKARRKELETTTQKFQAIFETAPTGLAVIDNDLNIIEANPRFLAMFQQTSACIGQSLAKLLSIEGLLETMQSVQTETTGLGSIEIEIPEPVFRTLLVNLSPLNDGQGWVLILHDITERNRLEGLKDEFVNIAAHELRTPLAGIMGFVGVLQEELKDSGDPMMVDLSNWILQATERLRAIIDELVKAVVTEPYTSQSLHVANINLNQLLHKTIGLLQNQIETKELDCHLQLPEEELIVQGDRFILDEVFYQILKNAVLFNESKGKIFVRARQLQEDEGEVTLIEVEDTGIGIPQTDLERVFDKFYQVEEHLTRDVGGLGLGLAIARRGVEQHGGKLTVNSQLRQGSVFRVVLPTIVHNDVSIDRRLDMAHHQMLAYAKDTANAIASQRRISQKISEIRQANLTLLEEIHHLVEHKQTDADCEAVLDKIRLRLEELVELTR